MKKYYVGFSILGVLTLILFVYVFIQGADYKKDKAANAAAVEIAEDLNAYIRTQQTIPENLSDAYSGDIPQEISFEKESDKRYRFCVTYASQSGPNLDAQSIVYQGLSGSFANQPSDYESSYTPSSLYISSYSWAAGEKCYTVEPSLYYRSSNFNNYNSSQSSFDYLCDESYQYYYLYEDDCEDGVYKYE